MRCTRSSRFAVAIATFAAAAAPVMAQPFTVDEFRRELVGVPPCGTPDPLDMRCTRSSRFAVAIATFAAAAAPVMAQPLTVDEFRRELVGVPLCGTPDSGPLAGKALCTVHLPDGTAILAGAGLVVYGL